MNIRLITVAILLVLALLAAHRLLKHGGEDKNLTRAIQKAEKL